MPVQRLWPAKAKRHKPRRKFDFLVAVGVFVLIVGGAVVLGGDVSPAKEDYAYRTCAEARAAGVAPIRVGQPGYAPHLDADGDGIACEPWLGRP